MEWRLLLLSLEPITGKVRCQRYISRTTERVRGFLLFSNFWRVILWLSAAAMAPILLNCVGNEYIKWVGNSRWIKNLLSFVLKLLRNCPPTPRQQVQVKNPYLDTMEEDILYHFSLGTKTHNLPEMFGDIKVREKDVLRKFKRVYSEAGQLKSLLPFYCFISFSNSLCVWVAVPTEWRLLLSSCTRSWNCLGTLKRSRIYVREQIVTACIKWVLFSLSA